MNHEYLLEFLEKKDIPTVHKLRHAYLTYYGLDQQNTYVLKEGVVKTSIILRDGREFNISYLKAPDIISLLRDEVSQYTSAPFNVRIESETAVFYKIPRVTFSGNLPPAAYDNEWKNRSGMCVFILADRTIWKENERRDTY